MDRFFVGIFLFLKRHSLLLWGMFLLIVGLCVYSVFDIRFVEDISSFLPQNEKNKRINHAYQHLGLANKIVVNIKMADDTVPPDEIDKTLLCDAATYFAELLSQNDTSHHIKNLLYEINQQQVAALTNFLIWNMPYFLSEDDYRRMDTLLSKEKIEEQLLKNKQLLLSPMGGFVRNILMADPLHFSNGILQGLNIFQPDSQYRIEDGFIFNKDATEALVSITSAYAVSETAQNKLLVNNIYHAIEQTKEQFNNQIEIIPFGAALVSISNAEQIKKDSFIAIGLALIFILALLIYFFRNVESLGLIVLAVLFGALFSLGVIVLFKDTVSIIALGIASIIMGIAINYPLHFLAHYRQEYDREQTIREIITPLLIGNITTVGAFLSLLFISSDAMKDLGLFASFLLLGTILFVLIFMPHFLRKNPLRNYRNEQTLFFGRLARFAPEKNKWIVSIVCLLTVVFFIFSLNTSFESDMHAINYMTKEQREQFNKLTKENAINQKTIYCISEGKNREDALANYEQCMLAIDSLFADRLIVRKNGIGIYLPSQKMQRVKIQQWNNFWKNRRASLIENIDKVATLQGYKEDAFDVFKSILQHNYKVEGQEYFSIIENNQAENYLSISPEKTTVFTLLQLEPENQSVVEEKLNAINDNIFVFDNASLTERMINALSDDFNNVFYICGLVVFFFLLFSFGRIELSLLAFVPLTVAWVWILGLMDIFGLKFNIVNIILATFIFGQGDDYTIFVTEGLLHEYTYGKKMLASFKNSIILSAIIMFLGIGMLIFAKHPAMRSLAEVTIVGMVSVVMMAYIFPPLLFNAMTKKKGRPRIIPVTLWNLFKSVISFVVFLVGSIFLTLIGFVLLTLGGNTKKHKYRYHQALCFLFKFLAQVMIEVPFKLVNEHNERFDKPGIILANHQSQFDLLYILMISPKIITLTNHWVWKSPFYGWIIRYADYLPLLNGIETHIDKLEKLINDGYSILIFPEGTRSEDCSIGRFRKGAFYLADKLNLDIIPIVTHGIGHVLSKREFILRKGKIHLQIEKRITPDDPMRKDKDILSFSKDMRAFYARKYAELVSELETPSYFKDKVYHNYIYKGASVERRAKKNLKRYNSYQDVIAHLPEQGRVLVINCGQGEFPLMAALVKKNLSITATDHDTHLLSIAENCMSIPHNLSYKRQIMDIDQYDFFVLFHPTEGQIKRIYNSKTPKLLINKEPFGLDMIFIISNLIDLIQETKHYTIYKVR
ncbi:MAG: MMPL family transporter [Bacteroidales bacterium]|jgi:1-acyl-sn-glycerol-3-phosphate acyltransferase|nr:MMPL family transporter [Bacteroidales bacterium]